MKKSWFQKQADVNSNKFHIPFYARSLIQSLRNRPSIRKNLSHVLKKIPITLKYESKILSKIYIDWERNDEIAEMSEQIESSSLLFLNTDLMPTSIFDIGASCGISTQILASQNPKSEITAFEPRPEAFLRLAKRVEKIKGNKVIHNAAVGLKRGVTSFKDSGVGTRRSKNDKDSFDANVMPIDKQKLSAAQNGLLLKIDIEGDEKILLPKIAGVLPAKTVLLLETHQPLAEVKDYASELLQLGFQWKLIRYRENPEYGGPFADWLVAGPGVHTN